MIYVLEGLKCVGKTTIAKRLADRLNVPYYCDIARNNRKKYYGIKDDEFQIEDWYISGIQNCLDIAIMSKNFDFVVDRWLLTNIVYDFNRGIEWKFNLIKNIIDLSNARVIYLVSNISTYKSRFLKRNEFFNMDDFNKLLYLYSKTINICSNLGMSIEEVENYYGDSSDDVIERIFERFN